MLSIPFLGYTIFKPREKEYKIKCDNEMINEWIKKATYGLKNKEPIILKAVSNKMTIRCTISFFSIHILIGEEIITDNRLNYEYIHKNMLDFCNELYKDISENKEKWINNLEKNEKEKLEENLNNLKEVIDGCQGDFIKYLSKCGCLQ